MIKILLNHDNYWKNTNKYIPSHVFIDLRVLLYFAFCREITVITLYFLHNIQSTLIIKQFISIIKYSNSIAFIEILSFMHVWDNENLCCSGWINWILKH